MRKKYIIAACIVIACLAIAGAVYALQGANFAVLNPKGTIGEQQRTLIYFASGLSLLVVIPVFAMTFFIAYKYRATNKKATYSPDWDHNKVAETIWWGIPIVLISILAVVAWVTSHSLDPYKPIASNEKPLKVQVVALEWKWLFIYPEQGVASVNTLAIPVHRPVSFEITADAPMNSFWIPQLGGQIYAMAGMSTKLHLMADYSGEFRGSSANLSGDGFAGMNFTTHAVSQSDFDDWVVKTKKLPDELSLTTYNSLAKPSKNNPPTFYGSINGNVYDTVLMKYMGPEHSAKQETMPLMEHTN